MHICDVEFCDFIVWTTKGLFVERIAPDPDFWTIATREAREFFVNGILPEIMGSGTQELLFHVQRTFHLQMMMTPIGVFASN